MSIQRIEVKLLSVADCKFLRTIKLTGLEWNKFTAFVSYFRDHDIPEIDDLDNCILESLKSYTIEAEYYSNCEIYLEGQADDILKRTDSSDFEYITIQFNPKSEERLYKLAALGNVYYYPKDFTVQIFKGHNYSGINKYLHAFLDYEFLERLIPTIQPV